MTGEMISSGAGNNQSAASSATLTVIAGAYDDPDFDLLDISSSWPDPFTFLVLSPVLDGLGLQPGDIIALDGIEGVETSAAPSIVAVSLEEDGKTVLLLRYMPRPGLLISHSSKRWEPQLRLSSDIRIVAAAPVSSTIHRFRCCSEH